MLIYYILTGGKHPYGSTPYDIQINMGRKICQLFYINEEANHMLSAMLPPSPFDRPSVSEVFKSVSIIYIFKLKCRRRVINGFTNLQKEEHMVCNAVNELKVTGQNGMDRKSYKYTCHEKPQDKIHPYFWADEKKLRFVLIAGSDVLRDLKAG
ncbi:hypothetical protein CHS0354_031055 [Potamilus streckersoni]|uniref:Uncharacterized protein n=1 Tax=Potamilus streckersoni TaxID=2493646 RepID=A0AAE0WBG7_9BIVA|nr:hypothetical protein CHS0354_031055 [Potamilus streckersoni]